MPETRLEWCLLIATILLLAVILGGCGAEPVKLNQAEILKCPQLKPTQDCPAKPGAPAHGDDLTDILIRWDDFEERDLCQAKLLMEWNDEWDSCTD